MTTALPRFTDRIGRRSDAITWTLAVGVEHVDADLVIGVTKDSPWCMLLGDFPVPMPEALEQIGRSLVELAGPPDRVIVVGTPSACLLPVLWLRSIWLEPGAHLELHWRTVAPPGPDHAEQHSAALCMAMVDDLRTDQPEDCLRLWGIRPGVQEPAEERSFTSMLALLELWSIRSRTGPIATPDEWMHRMSRALEQCAKAGHHRVALYGGGTHTRAVGPVLAETPVEIVAVIDDGTGDQGKHLWGFPIVTRSSALKLGLDAVILSANSVENKLWALCEPLREEGIEVIRLYADGVDLTPETFRRTSAAAAPLRARAALRERTKPATSNILAILASPPGVGRMFSALDDALLSQNSDLWSILDPTTGSAPAVGGIDAPTMSLIALARSWPTDGPLGQLPDDEVVQHCIAYESAYWRPIPEFQSLVRRGARISTWLIERTLDSLRPSLALIWNGEQGFSAIAASICRQHGIPLLFCERAGVSPALVVDPLGVHATSSMLLDETWRRLMNGRHDPELIGIGEAVGTIMLKERRENRSSSRGQVDGRLLDGASLVLLPSVEASLENRSLDHCAHLGSPLGDPLRAIDALLRAIPKKDRSIVLKPHPRDPHPERWAALCARHGVEYCETISIHDVLERGLPMATTSQALAWLGIAAGASVFSLNKRAYTGTGAVHDTHDPKLLRDMPSLLDSLRRDRRSGLVRERQLHVLGAYARHACHTTDPALLEAGVPGIEALAARMLDGHVRSGIAPNGTLWLDDLRAHGLASN